MMYWKSDSSPPAPMIVLLLTFLSLSNVLYRFVEPYDPAMLHTLLSSIGEDMTAVKYIAVIPSMSLAIMTPPLKVRPSTDVPVTYGVLQATTSLRPVNSRENNVHHDTLRLTDVVCFLGSPSCGAKAAGSITKGADPHKGVCAVYP